VQLFLEFDPREHFFTMVERRPDDFRRIALFDVVVNNADRKSGHCLLGDDDRVFVIDHGVCFSAAPKLRTVIWDFSGEPIPPDLCGDLDRLGTQLRKGSVRAELLELLDPAEVSATARRAAALVRAGRFPRPGPGRPYPWPPV